MTLLLLPAAQALRVAEPLPSLCRRAPVVAIGEVTGLETSWKEDQLVTLADFSVQRLLKGPAGDSLSILLPGGQLGELRQSISEAPRLEVDHRYLLLLQPGEGGYTVVGGPDGVLPLGWEKESEKAAIAGLGGCGA